ncbi:MAG TPA: CBS domain-containing protein [Ktedonobacteraceae bacterium]|nr:CBS domain-containing protein [Ktedonobacteraceae bacterium]
MIVAEIMSTRLVTVRPDDTLSHAANLLRQYQFHHLPVIRTVSVPLSASEHSEQSAQRSLRIIEGLLTSHDIDMAVAVSKSSASSDVLHQPWQERRVSTLMHRASIRVTPTTDVAAAAQLLVDRGLNALPVVSYEHVGDETYPDLVGLLTRSDLLIALSRSLGAFEPGMQLVIDLPVGDLTPLAQALQFATELHVPVRSVVAAPMEGNVPQTAALRIGTINPAPLLLRLQEANIHYTFADPLKEGNTHAR